MAPSSARDRPQVTLCYLEFRGRRGHVGGLSPVRSRSDVASRGGGACADRRASSGPPGCGEEHDQRLAGGERLLLMVAVGGDRLSISRRSSPKTSSRWRRQARSHSRGPAHASSKSSQRPPASTLPRCASPWIGCAGRSGRSSRAAASPEQRLAGQLGQPHGLRARVEAPQRVREGQRPLVERSERLARDGRGGRRATCQLPERDVAPVDDVRPRVDERARLHGELAEVARERDPAGDHFGRPDEMREPGHARDDRSRIAPDERAHPLAEHHWTLDLQTERARKRDGRVHASEPTR
jgi:hypothetical protein